MDALVDIVANVKTLSIRFDTDMRELSQPNVSHTIVTLMCGYFNFFWIFRLVYSAFITFNNKNS